MKKLLIIAALIYSTNALSEGLNLSKDRSKFLDTAREIISKDKYCALSTIDSSGQPRTRTVTPFVPEADMTIWIATKPNTRKVAQIRSNPNVTLYFEHDESMSYVTIMGVATLHNDLELKEKNNYYTKEELDAYWPNYPNDYLLIKVSPKWIEVEGHGIRGDESSWQPQAVNFEE